MAFPQIKTPLPLTVRKRQRRKNSSAVPLLLPVQSPAPQCASNNARPVITGACRSRLLGRIHRPFSRKARRGSSRGRPVLPCTNRQLSVTFFPGTLSRHSRIFHCPGVYSPGGLKSRDMTRLFFHLAHIMSESSSGKACPAGFAGHDSYKKSEVIAGHFTFLCLMYFCCYRMRTRMTAGMLLSFSLSRASTAPVASSMV